MTAKSIRRQCDPAKRYFARKLRSNQTKAERALWQYLRCRRTAGARFLRQVVIRGYIVDFYCAAALLAVEVDGSFHEGRERFDAIRDSRILDTGVEVIRFKNESVFNDIGHVLCQIERKIAERVLVTGRSVYRKTKGRRPTHNVEDGTSATWQTLKC